MAIIHEDITTGLMEILQVRSRALKQLLQMDLLLTLVIMSSQTFGEQEGLHGNRPGHFRSDGYLSRVIAVSDVGTAATTQQEQQR